MAYRESDRLRAGPPVDESRVTVDEMNVQQMVSRAQQDS